MVRLLTGPMNRQMLGMVPLGGRREFIFVENPVFVLQYHLAHNAWSVVAVEPGSE